jgi:homoserine dehydrogenase
LDKRRKIMRNINVGIIGFGTVGSGVVKALMEKRAYLRRRLGASINIAKVCDKDLRRKRPVQIDRRLLTRDVNQVIDNPEIDIVVELMGGISPAQDFIIRALKNRTHVVTANKALLSEEKRRLFKVADKNGVELRFEASVAGGVPIIKALREGFVANRIGSIYGIINGTCNYILSEMTQKHISFNAALEQAKKKGYAERKPALDIEGHDSAHKLAILASMVFGIDVRPRDIYVEGITNISDSDISYAAGFGYVIKLLAIAKKMGRELELRVHPTLVAKNHPLASVSSNFNAVFLESDMMGETLLYGQGSGSAPSASAVVSDIIDIARNILNQSEYKIPSIVYDKQVDRIKSQRDFYTSYYIRFSALDKPGVLAKISKILAQHRISIASVSQKARRRERIVPIVMMTHDAKESALSRALERIDNLDIIRKKSVIIRSEKDLE